MNRKISVVFVIFILSTTSVLSSLTSIAKDAETYFASVTADGNESHIIDHVSYFNQETDFYCRFASLTMLINYYVDNVTLKEVLFNSGIGYSFAYFHPLKLQPFSGTYVCQLHDYTGKFLASLYGLSHELWQPKITEDRWTQYWSRLKEKIRKDIPVLTDVDPLSLPWYIEHLNPPKGVHGGHSIVIVGYNESAGLVYYHDPALIRYRRDKQNCTYIPLSIENFKTALKYLTMPDEIMPATTKYIIESFEKVSSPLNKEEAFKLSHERNINRIKGKYSEILYKIIPFTDYGIKAVKAMNTDLRIGPRHRFATLMQMKILNIINYSFPEGSLKGQLMSILQLKAISTEKQNISQYLLKNQNLSKICKAEGLLLADEAKHWENLSVLVNDLFQTADNGFLKTRLESRLIIKNIRKELNVIEHIEKAIICLKTDKGLKN